MLGEAWPEFPFNQLIEYQIAPLAGCESMCSHQTSHGCEAYLAQSEDAARGTIMCMCVRVFVHVCRASSGTEWVDSVSGTNVKYDDHVHSCPFTAGAHQSRFVGTR